jgi:cell division septum initiation protein DivIVA
LEKELLIKNQLNDEKEKLQRENKELREKIEELKKEIEKLIKQKENFEKENIEMKKEEKNIKEKINLMDNTREKMNLKKDHILVFHNNHRFLVCKWLFYRGRICYDLG